MILNLISVLAVISLLTTYCCPYIHPKTISVIPLFGLAYPYILLGNLLLLIFWIFFKSKWIFAISLTILLGGSLHFRTFSFGSDDSFENETELNIMSYNVRLFDRYNTDRHKGNQTRINILKYLDDQQPDIICFQEFYQQDLTKTFFTKDSIKVLLKSVDYYESVKHRLKGRQNFGVALFSKYPIIEKGTLSFEESNSFNSCIYVDIIKDKDTFRIYNVHLESIRFKKDDYNLFNKEDLASEEKHTKIYNLLNKVRRAYPTRAKQAEVIRAHLKDSPYPVIVCGDFNDTPMSYTYNLFNSVLCDAYRNTSKGTGSTYAGKIPIGRIDYIFHSESLGSRNFKIQREKLSDHYAISCSILKEH